MAHLIDLGHTRIGLLTGIPSDRLRSIIPERRRAGYLDALTAANLTPDPVLEEQGHFSIDGGAKAMTAMLALAERPTAVFAMSDEMAFGAIQVARAAGLSVPGDLSVIGVDDHDLAPVMGLSTIRQHVIANGSLAAELLIDALAEPETGPTRQVVDYELVVRSTTGPPRT